MSELDAALQRLREANPDPADVDNLTGKTIHVRDNPHTFQSIFTQDGTRPGYHTCQLCGMQAPGNHFGPGIHPALAHVDWHNQLHRAGIGRDAA